MAEATFQYRLQRVLDYRELEEKWAKDLYLEKQAARFEAENELNEIERLRLQYLRMGADDLRARHELELRLTKLDDNERAQRLLIRQLEIEEDEARSIWLEKRQERSMIDKLRDKAKELFEHEELKKEQNALDEWATQRKRAA